MRSWLTWAAQRIALARLSSRHRSQSHAYSRSYFRHPRLERCEPRTLLTAFTVSVTGTGTGSLPWAVTQANDSPGSDAINFAAALSDTTIVLGAPLILTDTVGTTSIVGLGADHLALSGNNASRVFQIATGVTAEISGLTVENGRAVRGAGILNNGTLSVANAVFQNNQADFAGGAILN